MATKIDVTDAAGKKSGTVELPAAIFDAQTNVPLIHQVVVAQRAAARQGTHKTKNRGEVSGSGRKPFKQKGTGRARQGSVRMPQHKGGGVVHGPVPRDYAQRTPKKMIAAALIGALSDRARGGHVHVIDALVSGDKPSTKQAAAAIAQFVSNLRSPVTAVAPPREETASSGSPWWGAARSWERSGTWVSVLSRKGKSERMRTPCEPDDLYTRLRGVVQRPLAPSPPGAAGSGRGRVPAVPWGS